MWDDHGRGVQVGTNKRHKRRTEGDLNLKIFQNRRERKERNRGNASTTLGLFLHVMHIDTYTFLTKLRTIHHRVGSVLCPSLVGVIKSQVKEQFLA